MTASWDGSKTNPCDRPRVRRRRHVRRRTAPAPRDKNYLNRADASIAPSWPCSARVSWIASTKFASRRCRSVSNCCCGSFEQPQDKGIAPMTLAPSLREAMLGVVPSLRAFAMSLCGNVDRADDLVQETLLRAIANINSFEPGTNMSAWLFTILRNLFRSEYRNRRREVEDSDGSYVDSLKSPPQQQSRVEFE